MPVLPRLRAWLREATRDPRAERRALDALASRARALFYEATAAFYAGDPERHAAARREHAAVRAEWERRARSYEARFGA